MVKDRQLAHQVRELANSRQKNLMAPLDDNSMPAKGTSFIVGSWIFLAEGSGGFDSRPINQNTPKASEVTRCQEDDDFVDQLEEIKLPVHVNEVQNQLDFDAISPKTLFVTEEDLDKLLEITKQETTASGETPSPECQHDIIQAE